MAFYESVIIARPELTETQIDNLINDLSDIITKEKGKVIKKEQWGLRSFAYKINKNKKGHYFMLNLDTAPTIIFEYERQMRINEDIIRFLTIKIDKIDDNPSILSNENSKPMEEYKIKTNENDIPQNNDKIVEKNNE
jgi:small subunit ribosomal protein S6